MIAIEKLKKLYAAAMPKDPLGRAQCFWMPSWLAKLYAERAAYERAGRARAVVTDADIEAELAEVARRRGK